MMVTGGVSGCKTRHVRRVSLGAMITKIIVSLGAGGNVPERLLYVNIIFFLGRGKR